MTILELKNLKEIIRKSKIELPGIILDRDDIKVGRDISRKVAG